MKQNFQLRDVFSPAVVDQLAHNIARTWPTFDQIGFATTITTQLGPLSFGARNTLIRDTLWAYLPKDFPRAIQILLDSLGPEISQCEVTGFDAFIVMPQNDFVATYGLDYFDISMRALYEITKRFTAEGAIRAFIQTYPDQTLALLRRWAEDPNCHVRRLVSEGTRPRLPLAPRLAQFVRDPRPVLALLEQLKADPELMVRRSVANNLNDIAKDHADLVVETLARWRNVTNPGTQWIIGHAARTLVKQGHPDALRLLGYPSAISISVPGIQLTQRSVRLGEDLVFAFEVQSTADVAQNLMIDYVIYRRKANGKLTPKVFKLAKKKLPAREILRFSKRHSFRAINTRAYYPGQHMLELQINGRSWGQQTFEVEHLPQ
jgi:3-methyladenine DNA glycosylase AlkC